MPFFNAVSTLNPNPEESYALKSCDYFRGTSIENRHLIAAILHKMPQRSKAANKLGKGQLIQRTVFPTLFLRELTLSQKISDSIFADVFEDDANVVCVTLALWSLVSLVSFLNRKCTQRRRG